MYAIALLRYRRPIEDVLTVTDAHRAYLLGLKDRPLLLVSGPLNPRHGGALLLRVPDAGARETLDRIRDEDPGGPQNPAVIPPSTRRPITLPP